MVLKLPPLDWESSTLTTRPMQIQGVLNALQLGDLLKHTSIFLLFDFYSKYSGQFKGGILPCKVKIYIL